MMKNKLLLNLLLIFSFNHSVWAQSSVSAPKFANKAIVAFDGSCPLGWISVSQTMGRFLLGSGSGNTDAKGAVLTARTPASFGGHEFTTGIPASTQPSTTAYADPSLILGAFSGGPYEPYIYTDISNIDTTLSGSVADSNMPPFYTINFCKLE